MTRIAIIRIKGRVGLNKEIIDTLNRLRLRKKFVCTVIEPTKENLGMIKKVRNFIAYGTIGDETYKKLVEKRGEKGEENKLKPFFRLHPPRGGIDSKIHFGKKKGVLGDNKEEINKLIERML